MDELMPGAAADDEEGAELPTGAPTLVCSCGTSERHATDAERCVRGHVLVGNQTRRTHGAYSFRERGESSLPPDVRLTVAEFKQAVISDRGGLADVSSIEAARIGHLAEVETVLRLLASDLASRGLFTARGRVRSTFGRWLDAMATWERLAGHVGDDRRARPVPSLAAYLASAASANERNEGKQT